MSFPNDRLAPSVLSWVRNSNEDELTHRLEDVLRRNPEAAQRSIRWRPTTVTDFRRHQVHVSVQRVIRWDARHPHEIFERGFVPLITSERPANNEMDLWAHVQRNPDSIFVSTSVSQLRNGRQYWWTPREIRGMWLYEVFAPGGIDVNLSFGIHRYSNQHEMAFPGGIAPQFIRTVRQHDADGHVVAIWANGGFQPYAAVPLGNFPEPVCSSRVEVIYWTGPAHWAPLNTLRNAAASTADFLHQDGELEEDPLLGTCPARPRRACFIVPHTTHEAYFFGNTQCARIRVSPGGSNDQLLSGPSTITSVFPSFKDCGFSEVDAVLPADQDGGVYVFSGPYYALIQVTSSNPPRDRLVRGPLPITNEWNSLRQAGFKTIDAALISPTNRDEAYFFSGENYVLIGNIINGTDSIINGPNNITSQWPSLKQAGFNIVDAVLPSPNGNGEVYFFSGDQYVLVKVIPGTTDDYIITGPHQVSTNWPPLHQVGLY